MNDKEPTGAGGWGEIRQVAGSQLYQAFRFLLFE